MGRLALNRAKDFGDAKHDPILDFRFKNVDLDAPHILFAMSAKRE
jgi:hypothetical protein